MQTFDHVVRRLIGSLITVLSAAEHENTHFIKEIEHRLLVEINENSERNYPQPSSTFLLNCAFFMDVYFINS